MIVVMALMLSASGAHAQQTTPPSAREAADFPEDDGSDSGERMWFAGGSGGLGTFAGKTSATVSADIGVRLNERLSVFSEYGRYRDTNGAGLQPQVDLAVAQLAGRNIHVTGEAQQPTYYVVGGLRFDLSSIKRVKPYATGAAGWARTTPSARFTYITGTSTMSGRTAGAGEDATGDVISSGIYLGEVANAVMLRWGAGLLIPVGRKLSLDLGYVGSRTGGSTGMTMGGLAAGVSFHF
jgi:opacity protein-like surface antigen